MARLYQQTDFAVADKGKRLIVVVCVLADRIGTEHQTETAGVVGRFGGEGVCWRSQKVHIRASEVINKVQIVHLHALGIHREGVFPVLRGLEIDGYLICCAPSSMTNCDGCRIPMP